MVAKRGLGLNMFPKIRDSDAFNEAEDVSNNSRQ